MPENDDKQNPKPKSTVKVIAAVMVIIGIGIILFLLFMGTGSNGRNDDVSLEQINQESQQKTVVLYFWSNGCYYCTEQKPIVTDLEDDFGDGNVTFYWLDVTQNEDLTEHYDIYGYPTTIIITQNGVMKKFVGYTDYDVIASDINKAIDSYN
jgi:thiol-disulfide isomerase/thioredoxin